MASADNQARARFFGLLRQGGSNLGVTLAQYRESREMIVDRSDKLRGYNQWVYTRVQRNRRYWTRKGLLIPGWPWNSSSDGNHCVRTCGTQLTP